MWGFIFLCFVLALLYGTYRFFASMIRTFKEDLNGYRVWWEYPNKDAEYVRTLFKSLEEAKDVRDSMKAQYPRAKFWITKEGD